MAARRPREHAQNGPTESRVAEVAPPDLPAAISPIKCGGAPSCLVDQDQWACQSVRPRQELDQVDIDMQDAQSSTPAATRRQSG